MMDQIFTQVSIFALTMFAAPNSSYYTGTPNLASTFPTCAGSGRSSGFEATKSRTNKPPLLMKPYDSAFINKEMELGPTAAAGNKLFVCVYGH